MAIDYFSQFTPDSPVTLNANYEVPDWLRQQLGMFNDGADRVNNFFNANPQYAQDYQNILNGGVSAYDTSGRSLIKSDINSMSPEAAAFYSKNPNELLAAEGFGWDPTLAYMNYNHGPGSIGVNPKNGSVDNALRGNRWTPNGMVASNNLANYAATPYGAGTQSYLAAQAGQYGSTRPMTTQQAFGGGGGASMSSTFQQNPYAQQMAGNLSQQMGEQFQRQIAPQISSGAQLAGGYGGSRQGVLEANAANDLQQNTGQAVGTLLGNLYGQDLSYNLGMGNLGLGYANLDRSIANDNNQWGLQGAQLGMQLQDRQLQQNQMGLAQGTQIQNNPFNNLNQYGGLYNSIGQGYASNSSNQPGSALGGALGGAQLGSSLGKWWNSQNSNSSWGPGNANNMFNGVDVSPWSQGG